MPTLIQAYQAHKSRLQNTPLPRSPPRSRSPVSRARKSALQCDDFNAPDGSNPTFHPGNRDLEAEAFSAGVLADNLSKCITGNLNSSIWNPENEDKNPFIPYWQKSAFRAARAAEEALRESIRVQAEAEAKSKAEAEFATGNAAEGQSCNTALYTPPSSPPQMLRGQATAFVPSPLTTSPPTTLSSGEVNIMESPLDARTSRAGLGNSRWAVQAPSNPNPQPDGVIRGNSKNEKPLSCVPPHLRGIANRASPANLHDEVASQPNPLSFAQPTTQISQVVQNDSNGVCRTSTTTLKVNPHYVNAQGRQKDVDPAVFFAAFEERKASRISSDKAKSEKSDDSKSVVQTNDTRPITQALVTPIYTQSVEVSESESGDSKPVVQTNDIRPIAQAQVTPIYPQPVAASTANTSNVQHLNHRGYQRDVSPEEFMAAVFAKQSSRAPSSKAVSEKSDKPDTPSQEINIDSFPMAGPQIVEAQATITPTENNPKPIYLTPQGLQKDVSWSGFGGLPIEAEKKSIELPANGICATSAKEQPKNTSFTTTIEETVRAQPSQPGSVRAMPPNITPVQAASVENVSFEPASLEPTSLEPASVEAAFAQAAPAEATSIQAAPFEVKSVPKTTNTGRGLEIQFDAWIVSGHKKHFPSGSYRPSSIKSEDHSKNSDKPVATSHSFTPAAERNTHAQNIQTAPYHSQASPGSSDFNASSRHHTPQGKPKEVSSTASDVEKRVAPGNAQKLAQTPPRATSPKSRYPKPYTPPVAKYRPRQINNPHFHLGSGDEHIDKFFAYANAQPVNGKRYIYTGVDQKENQTNGGGDLILAPAVTPKLEQITQTIQVANHKFEEPADKLPIQQTATAVQAVLPKSKEPANKLSTNPAKQVTATTATNQWPTQNPKAFQKKLMDELKANNVIITPAIPSSPKKSSGDGSFDRQISDAGIFESANEVVRSTQAPNPSTQLLDWDGVHWAPAPCDWDDRGSFDNSFVINYIREWRSKPDFPCGPSVTVDSTSEKFATGTPVANERFLEPLDHPDCIPDTENSENESKRVSQTAADAAHRYLVKVQKQEAKEKAVRASQRAVYEEMANQEPEADPFSPAIDIYLRPAEEKDADDIIKIYNYYIANSNVPEDQEPLTRELGLALIQGSKREKLPFIVAVKGRLPNFMDAQGRPISSKKACMPQYEAVIGFSFMEHFNYGWAGTTTGRSRGTATLQLYVDHEHTRKGVGRNLLDRLLHIASHSYAYHNGCDWINPANDKHYESDGSGLWHQLLFMVPVLKKNDRNYPWLKEFLFQKFFFVEQTRLSSVARASIHHVGTGAYWLDMVILQRQATHGDEFELFT